MVIHNLHPRRVSRVLCPQWNVPLRTQVNTVQIFCVTGVLEMQMLCCLLALSSRHSKWERSSVFMLIPTMNALELVELLRVLPKKAIE
jgi:hypothetical protein